MNIAGKIIKRFIMFAVFIMSIALVIAIPVSTITADANSALLYYQSEQTAAEMLPLYDSDITVESEVLTFDFSGSDKYLNDFYIENGGMVKAEYSFRNAGETKTVSMGFPMVTTYEFLQAAAPTIKADDEVLDYDFYAIDGVNLADVVDMTFEDVLMGLNYENESNANLSEVTCTRHFIDKAKWSEDDENKHLYISFDAENNKTLVFFESNGYSQVMKSDERNYQLTFDIDKNFDMYIVGKEATNLKVYEKSDDKIIDRTGLIVEKETTMQEYANEIMKDKPEYIRNYAESVIKLQSVDMQDMLIPYSTITDRIFKEKLLFFAVYKAQLISGEDNKISITYPIEATYDGNYSPPVFKYEYISSPAKNWSDFGAMNIRIITNEDNPYVVDSNLDFTKIGDYEYSALINGVPEKNISFGVSADQNPKYAKDTKSNVSLILIIVFGVILSIIVLFIAVSAVVSIITRNKIIGKKGKQEHGRKNSDNT